MKEGYQEKRKLERFDLTIPARIGLTTADQAGEEKKILNVLTSDICSGGAFFHTTQPLPKGTEVRIDLVLPLDRLKELLGKSRHAYIQVTGTVLRSETKGMAICFNKDYQMHPCEPGEALRP